MLFSVDDDIDAFEILILQNDRDRQDLVTCAAAAGLGHLSVCKIVGLPISMLLQRHHATVSVVTKNPQELTCEADIVITDIGVPKIVRGSWLKPGTVVIDTRTNAVKDPEGKNGFRLAGDVCYEEAVRVASLITPVPGGLGPVTRVASLITPVPGGLGPVTISMLLSNTLDSAKHAYRFA